MSRTLIILITVVIVMLFVVSRFVNFDVKEKKFSQPVNSKEDTQFNSWIPYSSKNGSFSVRFPREPDHISQTTPDTFHRYQKHYEIYAANGLDTAAYLIQEITFSKEFLPEEDSIILTNTLNDILNSTKATLIESNEKKFLGSKALEFVLDNDQTRTNGLIFIKDKILYVISRTISQRYSKQNEDYQYFLESFKTMSNSKP